MAKLLAPVVVVTLEQDGSDDYLELTVQTDNRDAVQWDIVRARKEWPAGQDAPMLWMTFLAWSALHRTGQIKTEKVEEFIARCVNVTKPESVEVDPTQPEVAPGS